MLNIYIYIHKDCSVQRTCSTLNDVHLGAVRVSPGRTAQDFGLHGMEGVLLLGRLVGYPTLMRALRPNIASIFSLYTTYTTITVTGPGGPGQ